MTSDAPAQLYYATDTYCVWCWGFGPALREFAERHRDDARIDVVPGGLLVGERAVPVGQKLRVRESAARVAELCHVTFGDGFAAAVEEGSTVLDSLLAARLFVALRTELGNRAGLEIAHALQTAWYRDGRDLHDPAVRADVARSVGANPEAVEAHFADPSSTAAAEAEFQRRKDLQIKGYPSLLLQTEEGLQQVGGPTSSADRLDECFAALRAGQQPAFDPHDDEE